MTDIASDNGLDDVSDDDLAEVEDDTAEEEEPATDDGPSEDDWPDEAKAALAKLRQSEQRTRERYQPFERAFSGLNDENAAALVGFAQHLAGGDRVAVVNWLAENAVGMAGDDLVEELRTYGFTKREAEKAVAKAEDNGQAATEALTPEQIRDQILEQVRKEAEAERDKTNHQARLAAFTGEVDQHLRQMGYDPGTDEASDVMREATRLRERGQSTGSLAEDLAAAHASLLKRSTALVRASAAARRDKAGARPVPEGPAPVGGSTQSRVDRIAQKLEGAGDR